MKKPVLLTAVMAILLPAISQTDVRQPPGPGDSAKWQLGPAKNIKTGLGRLNLNFPPGTEWSVDIYSGNRFIINRSIETYKLKYHELAPGTYSFKLNTVMVENVPVEAGKITTLMTGILEINSNDWELKNESNQKFFTSGNTPKKLVLPVGKYQLTEGTNKRLVEVNPNATINPQVLVEDQFQYIMSPVAVVSDTALATQGRLIFNLTSYDYFSPGEGYEFRPHIYNEAGAEMHACIPGGSGFCTHTIYLAEGKYSVAATWADPHGSIEIKSPIRISNVPVKKGFETRIKIGFIRNLTKGDFELLDETKELIHCQYMNRGSSKRPLPVGKYFVRQPGIGIFPIEVGDRKEYSLNTIPPSKIEPPAFRISPITSNRIKTGKGRLICDFPHADTSYRLKIPNTNGGLTTIPLDTLKSIDLLPGNYELVLGSMTLPFRIEKQKETSIIHGYIKTSGNGFCDAVRGGCFNNLYDPVNTIPVRPGYYYINLGGNPDRQILIKVSEGEIVDFYQSMLIH